LVRTSKETNKKIDDIIGGQEVREKLGDASTAYGKLFSKTKKDISGLYDNATTKKALSTVRKDSDLYGITGKTDSSLDVAQAVKENLDDQISTLQRTGESKKASRLIDIKNKFVSKIDEQVPEYGSVRKEYADNAKALDVINEVTDFRKPMTVKQSRDIINANKDILKKSFGEKKTNKIVDILKEKAVKDENTNSLFNVAKSKLQKEDPMIKSRLREALETGGAALGEALDVATLKTSTKGRKALGDILLQQKPYTPIPTRSRLKGLPVGIIGATQGE